MGFLTGKKLLITGVLSQPLDRLRHRQGLPRARRRTGLQLCRRALQGPHHRIRGRLRLQADLRLRRRRRRADRQAVRRPGADLAQVRRLRAQHRLRAARGHRRRLPRRPVARGLQDRARHQRLQLPGDGQGRPALPQRQVGPADADLPGRVRAVPNYNTMGLAKASLEASVRYLAESLGPQGHARQRHQRRPDQDPGGQRHQGLRQAAAASWPRPRRCAAT